jgi:glycosyltransferase involved in cell wall biosynthesis
LSQEHPAVGIGLPVFNGENYLEQALDSLLAQTFRDFQLFISDNASTDRTPEICRAYAARDPRVSYSRNDTNLGASANYTRVFRGTRGRYFKWMAHDDLCQPTYLESCVAALEHDPGLALSHTQSVIIDAAGTVLAPHTLAGRCGSPRPHERFRDALFLGKAFPVWAVMRRAVLDRTSLLGDYAAHDRPLLSALSLLGRFHEVPETLYSVREHPERSIRKFPWRNPHQAIAWYAPHRAGSLMFPQWRLLREHLAGLRKAPIPLAEKARCIPHLLRWGQKHRKTFTQDLVLASLRLIPKR